MIVGTFLEFVGFITLVIFGAVALYWVIWMTLTMNEIVRWYEGKKRK